MAAAKEISDAEEKARQDAIEKAEVFQERELIGKDAVVKEDNSVAWAVHLQQSQNYAMRERNIALELNVLHSKITVEHDKQYKLKFKIEGFKATETICSRQLRALKAKRQNLQAKHRALTSWFKVDATGIFERERDRVISLLLLSAKLMEEKRVRSLATQEVIGQWELKSKVVRAKLVENTQKRNELQQIQTNILLGNETLALNLEDLNRDLQSKIDARDDIIKQKREREEQRRVLEHKLLLEACNKASEDIQIELDQLQVFNFTNLEIERVCSRSSILIN
jgi:hypothetical protein